jgi:hypothetical protein
MKTALDIIGWVSIALGCLLALGSATSGEYLSLAIASAVSGLVFLALGVIVEKLSEIEGHLRRANRAVAIAAPVEPELAKA